MNGVQQVSRRVDRLEEMMAELTSNVTHLSRDIRATEELIRYSNQALQKQIAEVSRDLRTNITNLALEMREADLRARQANQEMRQDINRLSQEMREADKRAREADERAREADERAREADERGREADERGREANQELGQSINRLSKEMREADERAREADERGREADERGREANQKLRKGIQELSHEMQLFREDTQKFKDEMREYKEEGKRQRRHLNKKMAEMSNKMGTLTEDMIAPSIPRILKTIMNLTEEPEMVGVRIRKRVNGKNREYDCIAVCEDYLLICESKSRLRPEDVREFRDQLSEARTFLPEYADKKIIGALGTFYVDPSLIKHGERMGLIMLGVIEGLMTILNEDGFVPQAF